MGTSQPVSQEYLELLRALNAAYNQYQQDQDRAAYTAKCDRLRKEYHDKLHPHREKAAPAALIEAVQTGEGEWDANRQK